jgi:hypothetical protein
VNTGNRVLWSIIGLLLLAAGVLGVMANRGWLPFVDRDQQALTPTAIQRWNSWGNWTTAVIIAAGLLLVVLGILLIRAQLRGRGGAPMGDLSMRRVAPREDSSPTEVPNAAPSTTAPSSDQPPITQAPSRADAGENGRTRVATSALSHALVHDLEGARQVEHAAVRIIGKPTVPQLLVRLSVTQDADMGGLAGHVDRAVGRFAATSGLNPHVAEVTVKVADRHPERVH